MWMGKLGEICNAIYRRGQGQIWDGKFDMRNSANQRRKG